MHFLYTHKCNYDIGLPLNWARIKLPIQDEWNRSQPLKLDFEMVAKRFVINFKPVQSQETLIGNYTPVWLAKSDQSAAQFVSYSPHLSVWKYIIML